MRAVLLAARLHAQLKDHLAELQPLTVPCVQHLDHVGPRLGEKVRRRGRAGRGGRAAGSAGSCSGRMPRARGDRRAASAAGRCCRRRGRHDRAPTPLILPARMAATPTAPAGSTTCLARSRRTSRARAMSSSDDGDDLVDEVADELERQVARPARPRCRPRWWAASRSPPGGRPQRGRVGGGVLGLDADDADGAAFRGGAGLGRRRDARDQSSAADPDDDGVDIRAPRRGARARACPVRR